MKNLVRAHFDELVNKRNANLIHVNMAADFHDHDGPRRTPANADDDERMMLRMFKAVPDLHVSIEDMVGENDEVICRNIWRWTDPVAGKSMEFRGFVE